MVDVNVFEVYAQYGAVGVIIFLFVWSYIQKTKENKVILQM